MIMSKKSEQHVDACRFCWMCHHICPVGNATGLERQTPRARALGLSLVNRETFGIEEVIDNVYECAGCGACVNVCVTGWDPVMFAKDTRLNAALNGKLPEYINKLVDNCLDKGNAYGKTEIDAKLLQAIKNHSEKTDTLLVLGTDTRYIEAGCGVDAITLLEKANVKFTVLENELPTGAQLDYLVSATEETKAQATAFADVINGYKTVIVYDPQDAKIIKHDYKEWGVNVNADVVTFTTELAKFLDNGSLKVSKCDCLVTYQDPFQLARDLGETEEARKVITACANFKEMLCNRKETMWAGNILMGEWMQDVMDKIALKRIFNSTSVGVEKIVTASVSEYHALRRVAGDNVKILSIEKIVLKHLA